MSLLETNWADVSETLLGRRDGGYDEVMDNIRYRIGREVYIQELEARLADVEETAAILRAKDAASQAREEKLRVKEGNARGLVQAQASTLRERDDELQTFRAREEELGTALARAQAVVDKPRPTFDMEVVSEFSAGRKAGREEVVSELVVALAPSLAEPETCPTCGAAAGNIGWIGGEGVMRCTNPCHSRTYSEEAAAKVNIRRLAVARIPHLHEPFTVGWCRCWLYLDSLAWLDLFPKED